MDNVLSRDEMVQQMIANAQKAMSENAMHLTEVAMPGVSTPVQTPDK